ncbi:cobalamin biosynthesis protein CobS [Lysinibacillus contaminans]|uniref:Adenosylcobinamide-GDP ribazoletransferase n=1 Tax=Lysinibacillus contaminans TaxID=1293441 RepID=A0ABR5K180_9BACI|nr:adenosylcobinamide-GDP ribazoletransferase [Lysinibacillus contaminans]KOS68614.1 cobalamin biosynthesis protein CobS [Lysinibacillus contaminans]
MKNIWHSVLLAFQFFTVLPVHKEIPLTKTTITGMFAFLPWVGAIMGGLVAASIYGLTEWTASSEILLAFVVIVLFALFTGGLHLDGFIDMGDAYFSYRDREKRLEILDDPRVGAFGVMSVLFLVLGKFVVLHELFAQDKLALWMLLFIPLVTRVGMSFYFMSLKCSKEKGLAYFFRTHIQPGMLVSWMIGTLIIAVSGAVYVTGALFVQFVLLAVLAVALFVFRQFTLRNFGGVSGDLLGASIEGMEVVLWVTLLLCV